MQIVKNTTILFDPAYVELYRHRFQKKEANINDVHLSFVGILGLEPRMTGPESVVLPLHHIPILLMS